jgi:hypothetical protein
MRLDGRPFPSQIRGCAVTGTRSADDGGRTAVLVAAVPVIRFFVHIFLRAK